MKKLLAIALLLMTAVLVAGCGDTTNATSTAAAPPVTSTDFVRSWTIQGKVMDAVTGEAIGGDTQLWLVQGATDRSPNKFHTAPTDVLLGEYAFTDIPTELVDNNAMFKIVAYKPGFQRFEANIDLISVPTAIAGLVIVEGVKNVIGNIYLYKLGETAGNVSVYVRDPHGVPVPNATVLLKQVANSNTTLADVGNRLGATATSSIFAAGVYSSLSMTTNGAGLATFSSANLTLGGNYNVTVEAMTFQGEMLANYAGTAFTVGTDNMTRVANMANAAGSVPLFVTNASNQVPGTITPSGVLTMTFNQPISLSTYTFTATLSSAGTGSLTAASYAGVLSNNGTLLTLTPGFATPVPATALGATLTWAWTGGNVTLLNSQSTGSSITGLTNITTGAASTGAVQLVTF